MSYEEMPTRRLGNTGERVSVVGLGGAHIGRKEVGGRDAVKIIRSAIDRGLTFMDNAWDYHGGQSEIRLGNALKDGYRKRAFVMTKLDGRTRKEANRQLHQSLKRLGVEYIDLLQHHEIIRFDDVDRIFAEDGAMSAFLEAQRAGKVRYIGFTGHKDPQIHLYMLETAKARGFRFDAVQMPLNVMDAHFRSFQTRVLPELVKENIGVLGMKSMGSGAILKSKVVRPIECLHYALSLPTCVVITGIDSMKILDQAFEAVSTFKPLNRQEMARLLARTKTVALRGEFELFKTTSHFDSTAQNPKWLGEEPSRVRILAGD